jgi:hypothetical protein
MENGIYLPSGFSGTSGHTRAAYMETEDTKTLFEVLIFLDDLCIKEEIAKPTGGQYLMRPRANDTR